MSSSAELPVIVAGGGAAGLAAAFRLGQSGHRVRVLEASGRIGGPLATSRRDGFVLDRGAVFLPTTYRNFLALLRDVGLGSEIVPGGFVFGIVRDATVHQIDGDHPVRDVARTRVVSPRAKLMAARLLPEILHSRKATVDRITEAAGYDTGTLADLCARLDSEVREYLVGPAIRGIFAAEPDQVSRVEFLGIIALFAGAKLVALRGGMGSYGEHMASRLDVTYGAEVTGVRWAREGVEVTWRDRGREHVETAAGCVVALPAQTAAAVVNDIDPWRTEFLRRIRRGKLVTPNIALSRAPAGVRATYTLVPRSEHPDVGGFACDHNKAPGRAPAGKGLITLTWTNDWCERHYDDDDHALSRASVEAADRLLPGVADSVEFVEISRWQQQYNPAGHYAQLPEFRARTATNDTVVQLAGEYLSAPNINAATASGEAAARALVRALSRPNPNPSPTSSIANVR
jgi:protoporphyrinogen/coproporphyrinogen III oxidase